MTTSKKKVVHIITGLNDGGAEGALYRLCLADKDAHHTVISMMSSGKYGPLLAREGVNVITLEMPCVAYGRTSFKPGFITPTCLAVWSHALPVCGGFFGGFATAILAPVR
jgi:hypothetical protein